jgi:hypothetical protein
MTTSSTEAPATPLRQRMQQDMLMRSLGVHTQQDYVRHVRRFAAKTALLRPQVYDRRFGGRYLPM